MSEQSSILLPSKLRTVLEERNNGVFEIEGLFPGYGHTLGNSLRRIILSSLEGTSVIAIKIEGVDHEFTTIEGVNEDVINIILNIKKVRFNTEGDEPQVAQLNFTGPGEVTAADIQGGGLVEVLNPEQYIASVTKKMKFSAEITIKKGRGYVSKENLFKEKVPAGTIAVDATFSPIRKVSYEVENMRVADRTDHNRLRISIQTDGSISPEQALSRSITIMREQLRAVLDLKEEEERIKTIIDSRPEIDTKGAEPHKETDTVIDMTDILKTRVDSLDLSNRTQGALESANIRTVGGLSKKTEQDLLDLDGIGEKGLQEIIESLKQLKVELAK